MKSSIVLSLLLLTGLTALAEKPREFKVQHTDAEWKEMLTPEQYQILRHKGTERAGTSSCTYLKDTGNYYCAGCHNLLFSSDSKFESGTGWPSFGIPVEGSVYKELDSSHGMRRSPRTRIQRRAAAHGSTLLHQRQSPQIREDQEVA